MSVYNIARAAAFVGLLAFSSTFYAPQSLGHNQDPIKSTSPMPITGHIDAVSARYFLESNPSTVVLDVRTEDETKSGFIVAAHFLDFHSPHFAKRLKNLDPAKTYLIHCNDADRSILTFHMLKDLGFKHVLHMDGGLNAWKAAGLPVSVPYGAPY